ncbi:MAG: rhomboid family intramembrane serine protease [Polyangiaceae bacterium]|nr:rhomboid family intramembrane serine protease [Polyangiaceae bacterium]
MSEEDLPGAETSRAASPLPGGFASYLARRLARDRGARLEVPEQARALAAAADFTVVEREPALVLHAIVDREHGGARRCGFLREELVDIGRACLVLTGTLNGAKLPVVLQLYEVADGPPEPADRVRLEELHKSVPGLAKVAIRCFHIDTRSGAVWSPGAWRGLLLGRRWLEELLRAPRLDAEALATPPAPAVPAPRHFPTATLGLLGLLVAVFAGELALRPAGKGAALDVGSLFAFGGMNRGAVLDEGEWYRLFTAALLHADVMHLGLNALALGFGGWLFESQLGAARFVGVFALGALGGSLAGLALNSVELVSVGASGAVMAVLAAALVASARVPRGAERMRRQMRLLQFLIPSLLPLATQRAGGRVDFAAHAGGAVAGALLGLAILRTWRRATPRPRFTGAARAVAAAGVLLFAASAAVAAVRFPAHAAEARSPLADLLVPDADIPKDTLVAQQQVERWGRGRPRDPRVHFFRALNLADGGQLARAADELRAALAETDLLARAFPDGRLEAGIRAVLAEVLLLQGQRDEALHEAAPVCRAPPDSAVAAELRQKGLCP